MRPVGAPSSGSHYTIQDSDNEDKKEGMRRLYEFDDQWRTERERLAVIEALWDPSTIESLESIGIQEGCTCLDVGAGGGSMAAWLCKKVGPSGRVVATDVETKFLEAVNEPNLEVRKHNIVRDALEENHFDFVHARAVLEYLPERNRALQNMVNAIKPDGWLFIGDVDYVSFVAQREEHADLFDRGRNAFLTLLSYAGWDPYYARKVAPALRNQGLSDVQSSVAVLEWDGTHPAASIWTYIYEQIRDYAVRDGLITDAEMGAIISLLSSPDFSAIGPIVCGVWGRKP
ncbi:MAG: methyltransferase domain-containing protein [Chloroflexota bacterium]|nr:methyltransferase domain-containing protein [Chloroflexota bacterium]